MSFKDHVEVRTRPAGTVSAFSQLKCPADILHEADSGYDPFFRLASSGIWRTLKISAKAKKTCRGGRKPEQIVVGRATWHVAVDLFKCGGNLRQVGNPEPRLAGRNVHGLAIFLSL